MNEYGTVILELSDQEKQGLGYLLEFDLGKFKLQPRIRVEQGGIGGSVVSEGIYL